MNTTNLKAIKNLTDEVNSTISECVSNRQNILSGLDQTISKAKAELDQHKGAAAKCVAKGDQEGFLKEKAAINTASDSIEYAELRKSQLINSGLMDYDAAMQFKAKADKLICAACGDIDKDLQKLHAQAEELHAAWQTINALESAMTGFNKSIVNTEEVGSFGNYCEPNTGYPDQESCIYSFVNHGYFEH